MSLELPRPDTTVDTAITGAATRTMSGGTVAAMAGWLTSNEGIAVVGILLTVLGFAVNLIFQIRRDYRERELHRAKLAVLQSGSSQNNSLAHATAFESEPRH